MNELIQQPRPRSITRSPRVIAGTNGTVQGLIALAISVERGDRLVAIEKLKPLK